ncbi:hypothetical protein AB0A95_27355 [Micromonospora sp. NPDC049230]|uniref:hypothetical protein n=1 Tax=Micromonospora sp. NPDC049230 TaxID=3155502 RepID=UPI0033E8CB04
MRETSQFSGAHQSQPVTRPAADVVLADGVEVVWEAVTGRATARAATTAAMCFLNN